MNIPFASQLLSTNTIPFTPRTEQTNTHRNLVDDHISQITTWKVIDTKYYLTLLFYFLSVGILFILTFIKRTLIISLYCEESSPEQADYVIITDYNGKEYLCSLIHQRFHDVHQVFQKCPNIMNRMSVMKENSVYLNKNVNESDKNAYGIVFYFKNMKYIYSYGCFCPVYFNLGKYTNEEVFDLFNHGDRKYYYYNSGDSIDSCPSLTEYNYLLNKYGVNELTGDAKNIFAIFMKQFFNVMNLYSCFCIIVWYAIKYIAFATLILIFCIVTLIYSTGSAYQISRKIYDIKKKANISTTARFSSETSSSSTTNRKTSFIYTSMQHEQQDNTIEREFSNEVKTLIPNIRSAWSVVPGEVIRIKPNHVMEFDGLILTGYCIVDESELTGETNEVYKTQILHNREPFKYDSNHFLFQGTLVKECDGDYGEEELTVLVVNTGMNTNRANLLLNLAFPKTSNYSFSKDIWLFVLIMFIFWFAIVLTISIISGYSHILISASLPVLLPPTMYFTFTYSNHCHKAYLQKHNIQCVNKDKITAAGKSKIIVLDKTGTLTEDQFELYGYQFTMPQNLINGNCNNSNINYGKIELSDVDSSSKILNKIHQEFWKNYTNEINTSYQNDPRYNIIYFTECLGCCHGINKFGDKDLGDSIDKKILESIKWMIQIEKKRNSRNVLRYIMPTNLYKITEKAFFEQLKINIDKNEQFKKGKLFKKDKNLLKQPSQYKILIEKIFNFSSETQSNCVITKNLLDGSRRIFIKGAPEKILSICTLASKPLNVMDKINDLTKQGLRVIACSTRVLSENEYISFSSNENNSTIIASSQDTNPIDKERNMTFLGLVIFKNPLKKDTQNVIKKLHNANYKLVMSTGDNECTSYYVAQQSNMVSPNTTRYILETNIKGDTLYLKEQHSFSSISASSHISYNLSIINNNNNPSMDNSFINNDSPIDYNENNIYPLIPLEKNINSNLELIHNLINSKEPITLSVSGSALRFIFTQLKRNDTMYIDKEQKVTKTEMALFLRKYGFIYYRMTPKNKAELIEFFKSDNHSIVIMCGDGSNDIPAILEADIGIALNQKNNLHILSHFYMNNSSIQCVETIVKTGRACCEGNEMIFKFTFISGIIKLITSSCLHLIQNHILSLQQNAYLDFLCILLPLLFTCHTTPSLMLSKYSVHKRLFNKKLLVSGIGHVIMHCCVQISFFKLLSMFIDYGALKRNNVTVIGSYMFLFNAFQFLICNFILNSQSVHRKHIMTNSVYLVMLFLGLLVTLLFLSKKEYALMKLVGDIVMLEEDSSNFELYLEFNKLLLQLFVIGISVLSFLYEMVISNKLINY